jgi:glycerol uptake facilitator-like aquaporin
MLADSITFCQNNKFEFVIFIIVILMVQIKLFEFTDSGARSFLLHLIVEIMITFMLVIVIRVIAVEKIKIDFISNQKITTKLIFFMLE